MGDKRIEQIENLRKMREELLNSIKEDNSTENNTQNLNQNNGNSNEQGKVLTKSNGHSTLSNVDIFNQRAGKTNVLELAVITFITEVAFLVIAYLIYK